MWEVVLKSAKGVCYMSTLVFLVSELVPLFGSALNPSHRLMCLVMFATCDFGVNKLVSVTMGTVVKTL